MSVERAREKRGKREGEKKRVSEPKAQDLTWAFF